MRDREGSTSRSVSVLVRIWPSKVELIRKFIRSFNVFFFFLRSLCAFLFSFLCFVRCWWCRHCCCLFSVLVVVVAARASNEFNIVLWMRELELNEHQRKKITTALASTKNRSCTRISIQFINEKTSLIAKTDSIKFGAFL